MSFIQRFLGKGPLKANSQDVLKFITQPNPVEENMNLDYKAIPSTGINFDSVAKIVSAFANSEGGLLILGVSETKTGRGRKTRVYPGTITWGDSSLTRETLEQHLVGKIHPRIGDMRIVPVRKSSKDNSMIFLIDVQRSSNPPHMATPFKQYFKRLNFQITSMGHYEIQSLFNIHHLLKEKLVEKIFEPLSKIINKHLKALETYSHLDTYEAEEVLSNVYYRIQMPLELQEDIIVYLENIDSINKQISDVQEIIRNILYETVLQHLTLTYNEDELNRIIINFKPIGKNLVGSMSIHNLVQSILKNIEYEDIVTSDYTHIIIGYNNVDHTLDVNTFKKEIWLLCLNRVIKLKMIKEMKQNILKVETEAWDLIKSMLQK